MSVRIRLRPRLDGIEAPSDFASDIGEDSVEIEIADLDTGDGRVIELIMWIRPAG
jgi:hypothetical protein